MKKQTLCSASGDKGAAMNHTFNCQVAAQYGMLEAVIIWNFQHWIRLNRDNKRNFHDGRTWSYNSVQALSKQYFYVSADKVRRALDKLVEKGVLVKGNYSERPADRTTWYAFADEDSWVPELDHLASVPNGSGKDAKPFGKGAKSTNKTDIDTDIDADKSRAKRATRLPADWMPSDSDCAFLTANRPDLDLNTVADSFRDYWISQPNGSKLDWSATWRTWVRKEHKQSPAAKPAKQSRHSGFDDMDYSGGL
jgi:hypothetical protein